MHKSNYQVTEELDLAVKEILTDAIPDRAKIQKILESKGQALKKKSNNLSESTYFDLIQLFIRNGELNHASYFLCKLDKLKIKIPRRILDLFLETNISSKKSNEKHKYGRKEYQPPKNKFDDPNVANTKEDFNNNIYGNTGNNTAIDPNVDVQNMFSKLNLESKPFVPKKSMEIKKTESMEEKPTELKDEDKLQKEDNILEKKFSGVDPSSIKEFVPKNYKIVNKN